MTGKPSGFGKAGVALGLVCLATLFVIETFGPGSYSGGGSGSVMADGTVIMNSSQPVLPLVAQTAFFMLLVSLVFGAIAVFRKENIYLAVGAFCLGLAPILIYTVGVFFSSLVYFGISLPVLGIAAFKSK